MSEDGGWTRPEGGSLRRKNKIFLGIRSGALPQGFGWSKKKSTTAGLKLAIDKAAIFRDLAEAEDELLQEAARAEAVEQDHEGRGGAGLVARGDIRLDGAIAAEGGEIDGLFLERGGARVGRGAGGEEE